MSDLQQINLIPHTKLSNEALQNLIEQFVSRDGIDSGHVETPLEKKVEIVKSQLNQGKIVIIFNPNTQTCDIIPKDQIPPDIHFQGDKPEKLLPIKSIK
jgi:uncharacterized protein